MEPLAVLKESESALINQCTNIQGCIKCDLHKTRKNIVFGEGNSETKLMIIGEAPGANEDHTGRPFVGRAGQLLTKMIQAMKLNREDVYITNTVKCRPPDNRNPTIDEVKACSSYLQSQINIIKPQVIILTGLVATKAFYQDETLIMKHMRGKVKEHNGTKVISIYHPAALLRNPTFKQVTWEDLQLVMELLNDKEEKEANSEAD